MADVDGIAVNIESVVYCSGLGGDRRYVVRGRGEAASGGW